MNIEKALNTTTPNDNKENIDDITLSIVIPAYNEALRIGATLDSILTWLNKDGRQAEILVIDDGSTDNTCNVVNDCAVSDKRIQLVKNGKNKGKGFSVGHGVTKASGSWILISDADLSTPIEELLTLEACNKNAAVIIGSRALPDSDLKKRQPFYREIMGRVFNFLVQSLVFPGIKDTQCGFKLFRADIAKKLFAHRHIDGFAFDVEILFLARKYGHNVIETPVVWINDEASRVNPIRNSIQMFFDIIKIRKHHQHIDKK